MGGRGGNLLSSVVSKYSFLRGARASSSSEEVSQERSNVLDRARQSVWAHEKQPR